MIGKGLTWILITLVNIYQLAVRPVFPSACRFYPHCSAYFILSVRKYGPLKGSLNGAKRICRCHPWSAGGYDPP